jgi:phosphatidylserine/phosphatidylglycerophosphate/cardiolipin synthase-like enzyme
MSHSHIALVAEGIADARERMPDPDVLFDLVLSGPDVPGIPTADTAAVVHTVFEEAKTEVLLVGYAIHNGEHLFAPLATKMRKIPDLRVIFYLDIGRRFGDTSLSNEIVRRFVHEFRTKHWPWPELPEVYYDPRSLAENTEERSSLHAKCVIVDRRVALVTSANFTEAAQERNIEAGVVVRYQPVVERLADYFGTLRSSDRLRRCRLT